jgi:multimeric flavodoxin WrbA
MFLSMKKILVLNGGPHKTGNTMTLVNEVLKTIKDTEIEVKTYNLNTMQIKGCQGCYACKKTGNCIIKDDMQQIYQDINDTDSIIFSTPVFMWQMSAQLKLTIDRLFPYLKDDYSSYLSPNKKVLFVATYGGGILSQYQAYFDLTCRSLVFLGFGEYKILITKSLSEPKELSESSEVLSEAKDLGKWLLSC